MVSILKGFKEENCTILNNIKKVINKVQPEGQRKKRRIVHPAP